MKVHLLVGLIMMMTGTALAGERTTLTGAVAYTEMVRFDYTKEGKRANVQFWLEFRGKGAVGSEGDPGYLPPEGAIYYYLLDVDKNEKVTNWLMGFSMMSEPPPSGPYPMTNLVIRGNVASFDAFNRNWKITDGGKGFAKDTVIVKDGFKPKEMKMYGGDVLISP